MSKKAEFVPWYGANEVQELIHRRRRQVLYHSILYYKFNTTVIEDSVFDKWALELVELQTKHPKDSAAVPYMLEAFKDFTGETGFHLPLGDLRTHNVIAHNMRGRT